MVAPSIAISSRFRSVAGKPAVASVWFAVALVSGQLGAQPRWRRETVGLLARVELDLGDAQSVQRPRVDVDLGPAPVTQRHVVADLAQPHLGALVEGEVALLDLGPAALGPWHLADQEPALDLGHAGIVGPRSNGPP
ncbi:MAG TPA: hypothetical protein VHV53_00775 [Solirubrobacterales bacterium]|nr:hypothetical protein [Solirubrobacterales bacterium]